MALNDSIEIFRHRVTTLWLPKYCADPKRQYSPDGFKIESIKVDSIDARDCMRAIDAGVVRDVGRSCYLAFRGEFPEPLFWEGSRKKIPRTITLWLEPVITFAALGRLHFEYSWPLELLGNQPKGWAFDLAAHNPADPKQYRILGEVKKTSKEAESLLADLKQACYEQSASSIPKNSANKWDSLLQTKPPILWIIGPGGYSRVFHCTYQSRGDVSMHETTDMALRYVGHLGSHL